MAHLLRSNTQISWHPRESRALSQSKLMWNSSEDLFSSIRGKHEHTNAVLLACGLCQTGMPDAEILLGPSNLGPSSGWFQPTAIQDSKP